MFMFMFMFMFLFMFMRPHLGLSSPWLTLVLLAFYTSIHPRFLFLIVHISLFLWCIRRISFTGPLSNFSVSFSPGQREDLALGKDATEFSIPSSFDVYSAVLLR